MTSVLAPEMSSDQPEAISSLRFKSKGDRCNHTDTRNACFRDTADMKPFNELSMLFLCGQRHLTLNSTFFLGGGRIKSNASG